MLNHTACQQNSDIQVAHEGLCDQDVIDNNQAKQKDNNTDENDNSESFDRNGDDEAKQDNDKEDQEILRDDSKDTDATEEEGK